MDGDENIYIRYMYESEYTPHILDVFYYIWSCDNSEEMTLCYNVTQWVYSLYNTVHLMSLQNNTQTLMSKPLEAKVSTPLRKNVQIGPSYPWYPSSVMWLVGVNKFSGVNGEQVCNLLSLSFLLITGSSTRHLMEKNSEDLK